MNRNNFLKSLIGIPIIGGLLTKIPEQTDSEIADELVKQLRKDGISVYSKVNPPKWEFTGLSRLVKGSVQHQDIDNNKNSPTYRETRWVYVPFIKDPNHTIIK